jgi:DNA (cytosine-5)-methyltransferase 1
MEMEERDVSYSDGEFIKTPLERSRNGQFTNGDWRNVKSELGGMADGFPAGVDGVITFPEEPNIPRVAKGIKNRVDRIKCLGNAVVPQQVYPILAAIAEIEKISGDYVN